MTVVLDSLKDFSLENLKRVAWQGEAVDFGPAALARMAQARADFLDMIAKDPARHIYGVTTGFGDRAREMLSPEEREAQAKVPAWLVGTSMGEPLAPRLVRAMIFARLTNFVSGYAAVSLETAKAVAAMLDGRPLPVLRAEGQDSEGELHQFFNLFGHLMGPMSQLRDQNALRNGVACAPALLADLALRARRRWRLAVRVFALSIDAGNMGLNPYDPVLIPLLDDACEAETITALAEDLAGVTEEGRRPFQSPISWRIVTRMAGQALRAVEEVETAARHLLATCSDNPVYLSPTEAPPLGRVLSTGGFHAPRAYQAANYLAAHWADLTSIIARQVGLLFKNSVTGLPEKLLRPGERHAGFFMGTVAYDFARRAHEAAAPALTPLYTGHDEQTDIIFPIFQAFEKEALVSKALDRCLALLAASASQALEVAGRPPAPPLRPFLADIRKHFPLLTGARDLGADGERLAEAFAAHTLSYEMGEG